MKRNLLDLEPNYGENHLEDLDLEYILTDKEEDNLRSMNNISEVDLWIDQIKTRIKTAKETRGTRVNYLKSQRDELQEKIDALTEPGK